jgi:hypothetical protein
MEDGWAIAAPSDEALDAKVLSGMAEFANADPRAKDLAQRR